MDNKKTIIIISDYGCINGGNAKIAIMTASLLAEKGMKVVFFCAVGPIDNMLEHKNINVVCLNQNDINNKGRIKAVIEGINNKVAVKEFKKTLSVVDGEIIVHIHSWSKALSSAIFKVLKHRKDVKTVLTVHDFFYVCPNGGLYNYKANRICGIRSDFKCMLCNCDKRNYFQKIFRYVRYFFQKRHMCKINNFIYISETAHKAFLTRYSKNGNFYYLSNFVEGFHQSNEHASHKGDKYLYLGRVSEEKGISLFCEALKACNKQGIIIGTGPIYDALKEKYPEFEFTGWLDKESIKKKMLECRALVFPSLWYETFGLTPLEAMSNGLPVIVSDCTAAKEYIIDGKNGLIFKNNDLDDLVAKIRWMSDDKNYSSLTPSYVENDFSTEHYINNLIKIYNELK